MLTPPEISEDSIVTLLRESYGLRIARVAFLPLGADANSAAFRVDSNAAIPCFLKLRRNGFREAAAALPAFLHARGVRRVMAPIPTVRGEFWAFAHGFAWTLYPFFEGLDGYEVALSAKQWSALGETMRAVHSARLPASLADKLPRESYSPRWRDTREYDAVRHFDREADRRHGDPIAVALAELWRAKRVEIRLIVDRAEELGLRLQSTSLAQMVCHGDLHGANVLVGADDELRVVDWDEVIFAPKERDLMSVGGGLFGQQSPALEAAWFYEGYGRVEIDALALAYYRYERIAADLAAYADQIFGLRGSADDRGLGLRQLASQFLPGHVIEIAHRTYPGD